MRTWLLVGVALVAIGLGCGSQAHDGSDRPDASCSSERCDGKDNNCDGQIDEGFDVGAPCSVGVGACRVEGVRVCLADGEGTVCSAQAGASTFERCNGVDDNCDGQVDEGFGLGAMCTAGVGGCVRAGTVVCDLATGEATCSVQPRTATAEVCNGIDDNCDGQVDEGFGVGTPCEAGVGACRATGVTVCDEVGGTRCDAVAGAPSEERCNGIDDDCNGMVDDLPGLGGACTASALGICAQGHTVCSDHGPVCAPGTPQPEICNGLDDNCNGQVDDGFATGGLCEVGVGACQRTGVTVCDGALATRCNATPGAPSPETCNGTDDDCNGTIDDVAGLGDHCEASAPGSCAQGHLACGSDALVCVPGTPQPETCDGVDDNCDGQVDESDPRLGSSCATGQLGACNAGSFVCATGGHLVCQPLSAPSSERCNGVDDDCNGLVDDACLPDPPQARFPWNGLQTGSPWVPAATPLRPRFLWSAVTGAERYEIEIDDSCPAAFRDCTFPSPEIRVAVTASAFQPDAPLAVALTPPVGRRYYWHVRACTGSQCSAFTEVRYVDIGRVSGDIDGDGYPDLLVQGLDSGPFAVYRGGATGVSVDPAMIVSPPPSGVPNAPNAFRTMGAVGDLNGDGFADVCVPYGNSSAEGGRLIISRVALYYGGPGGLTGQPSATLSSPAPTSPDFFGPCYGVGDVNGDGQDDLIVTGNIADTVLLYPGGAAGVAAVPSIVLVDPGPPPGFSRDFAPAARLGDIDGDGYPDFAISAPDEPPTVLFPRQGRAGAVYVYRGGRAGPAATPSQVIRNSIDPTRVSFGHVVKGNRDLDGDGLADVAIVPDPVLDSQFDGPGPPNAVYVYHGSPAGLEDPPAETVRSPRQAGDLFAFAAALGDVNGDGAVDLVTGDPAFGEVNGVRSIGIAELYLGAAGRLGPSPDQSMPNPVPPSFEALFGFGVAVCDLDADGFDERVISDPNEGIFDPGVVYIYPGSAMPTNAPGLMIVAPPHFSGSNFGWVLSCGQ